MAMCEICGKRQVIPVTQDMFDHVQAFQKGAAGWILDRDFVIIGGFAMTPEKQIAEQV